MKRQCLVVAALAAAFGFVSGANAAVTLKIRNFSGQPVWLLWTGTSGLTGTATNTLGQAISIANSDYNSNAGGYGLAPGSGANLLQPTAPNEYQISGFTMNGGRMWFTYGSGPWAFQNAGYTPPFATFNDPNFTVRYDKIEASIIGSTSDNLDMTAVDGFSIPFTVKGYQSSNPSTTTQTLKGSLGKTIYQALAAVAADTKASAPTTPPNASPALSAITGNSAYVAINANSQGIIPAPNPPYNGYQYSPIGQGGGFVRIIGNDNLIAPYGGDPVAAANGNAVPSNYNWPSYENYLKRMDGRAAKTYKGTTTLAGSFVGVKPFSTALTAPASYSLTAAFDPTETLTVTYTVPGSGAGTGPYSIQFTGVVTLTGTSTFTSGSSFSGTYTVAIKLPYGGLPAYYSILTPGFAYPNAFMLDPTGVVGANANYLYKFYLQGTPDPGWSQTNPYGGGPQNNVLTQIEGDLFAGMNVGAVGSSTTLASALVINSNTYPAGTAVGAMNSQDWFSLGSALAAQNQAGGVYDYYFGYLQSDPDLYNKYAEALYPLSDAYGFAYSDRINGGRVAIAWDATQSNAIDTIEITILPDEGTPLLASTPAVEAVEYYNESLGHYFVTWAPDEIAKLDAGTVIKGWARTGRSIRTFSSPQPGTTPVCRYYIPPSLGNSHFYGRSPEECSATAAKNPGFVLESSAFMHMFLPSQGVCPANTSAVYRVYNNRLDTNHRYLNDLATRTQMVVRGWLAEGDGNDRVVMCAPL